MFRDLKPYPDYVTRVGASLPATPTAWSRRRIKTLLREVDRRSATGSERLLSLRAGQGLIDHLEAGGKGIAPEALVGYKIALPGDLVMNRMRAASGVFGLAGSSGLVSPDYALFRRLGAGEPDYLLALLRSVPVAAEMRRRSRGMGTGESGFLRLYTDAFGAMEVPWPSPKEQAAIVKYLAHAHARIDRAIAAKRKLITLLEEQKQAIINQAVTRGLDPTVPMKDSGIPWIGEIPTEWQVRRLRTLLTGVDQGVSPQAEGATPSADEWGVLKSGCVNGGVFREDQSKRLPLGFDVPTEHQVIVGDVLVSRASGSPRLVGSTARVTEIQKRLILSDKTFRLHFSNVVLPDYMVLVMNSGPYREQVLTSLSGAGGLANNLPVSVLRRFVFAIGQLNEQRAIVERVSSEIVLAEIAVARTRREIDLLREFRARLTSDVVTGQLDVRGSAAALPDFVASVSIDADGDDDESIEDLDHVLEEADA